MTPRQIAACLHFADRRKRREASERLLVLRLAAHGEKKDIEDALKGWADGGSEPALHPSQVSQPVRRPRPAE